MFLRLLFIVFFLVLVRFVVSLVRFAWRLGASKPEVQSRSRADREPIRGGKVIDVDFTEETTDRTRPDKDSR